MLEFSASQLRSRFVFRVREPQQGKTVSPPEGHLLTHESRFFQSALTLTGSKRCKAGTFGFVPAFDPSSAHSSRPSLLEREVSSVYRSFMSQVELKEAQSSFVLLSRGASRKQLKLKTAGAHGRESNRLRVRTHEWGGKQAR